MSTALTYVMRRLGGSPRRRGVGLYYRPTTAGLRRVLHEVETPVLIKNKIYSWLRVRRG